MFAPVFQSQIGVTLLGAGDATPQDVSEALSLAPNLVCADGGAVKALQLGLVPKAVIGDFDSLDQDTLGQLAKDSLFRVEEQDSTDFEKCLRRIETPFVIGVGFTGARRDHELAAYSTLLACPDQLCLLLSEEEVIFAMPPAVSFDLPLGSRFSLFPMGRVSGRSQGLKWPIDGLQFEPGGRLGTSNEVTGPVHIEMDGPGMLALMPRALVRAALAGLLG